MKGKCDRCGKTRLLAPGLWVEEPNGPVPQFCRPCRRRAKASEPWAERFVGAVTAWRREEDERRAKERSELRRKQAAVPKASNRGEAVANRSRRPSLSPEGNLRLTVRLLREARAAGKTRKESKKETRQTLRRMYEAIGQTDKKWIDKRIRDYVRQAIRELKKGS